jgi:hypothetical protein
LLYLSLRYASIDEQCMEIYLDDKNDIKQLIIEKSYGEISKWSSLVYLLKAIQNKKSKIICAI